MLAAATAWDDLAVELHYLASAYRSIVTGLINGPWHGPAALAAAAAAAPYVAWMSSTAQQAEQAAAQARTAVSAYEAAVTMTVPPPVIAANRAVLAELVATNFFGQNSPAIAATEAQYGEMWCQDAAAMYTYAGSSASASTLTPFISPPQLTDPAGLARQASAVMTAAKAAAIQHLPLNSLVSSVPALLQRLATPNPDTKAMVQELMLLLPDYLMVAATPLYALSSVLAMAQTMQGMTGAAAQAALAATAGEAASWAGNAAKTGAELVSSTALANMGKASALGPLSIPQGWTSVIPGTGLNMATGPLGGGVNATETLSPSLLSGVPPRTVSGSVPPNTAPPRYGVVPTVMAQPPAGGYGPAF